MCSNKPNIQGALAKMYHCNQPVYITTYIEHKPIIANGIHTVKGPFYITEIWPVAK